MRDGANRQVLYASGNAAFQDCLVAVSEEYDRPSLLSIPETGPAGAEIQKK
jgi:hypothetical protein